MRVLVTGVNGLLGPFLVEELTAKGYPLLATGKGPCRLDIKPHWDSTVYQELDITDTQKVHATIQEWKPEIIIHAAAWTQADPCEQDPEGCRKVNVEATAQLCQEATRAGAKMIYVSTDFVFDGNHGPYREEDIPNPVNIYGASKLEAEKIVAAVHPDAAIVRTVLVYGHANNITRTSLMTWVRDKLSKGETIKVVNDQVRTPTYAGDLARGIRLVLEKNASGIFHISGKDVLTPWDMAMATADLLDLDKSLMQPVNASTFTQPARRPLRTGFVLDKAREILGYEPISFSEGLRRCFGSDLE